MYPLEPSAVKRLMEGETFSHRSTAIRHAVIHDRPGLVGDHPVRPSGVAWLRPGDSGGWEAFSSGHPDQVLDLIEARVQGSSVALLAPSSWEASVRRRRGTIETATIQTFVDFDLMKLTRFAPECRVLQAEDAQTFKTIAPDWALRSWGDFSSMLAHGLAIGLQSVNGFVSVAWTYESTLEHDKIGVATLPRYRGLGLGRRVAGALIERVVNDRRKSPTWITSAENVASISLASSLGFENPTAETLLRWTP